jgi:NAD(P)-dependent dehydrogenase (short-subunit alcohol dehydrogenase family)
MRRLEGKVAIITGGSAGIGRGLSRAFAREGAQLTIASRSQQNLDNIQKEMEELDADTLTCVCDIANPADIQATVERTLERFNTIDVLVNNAHARPSTRAVDSKGFSFLDTTDDYITAHVTGAVLGTIHFMKACYPHMEGRGGSIINFGSGAGVSGMANYLAYAIAKESIRVATRVAAREWGPLGIRANVICPSALELPESKEWLRSLPEDVRQRMSEGRPLRRWGEAERDIGGVAVFLASDDSGYITGQTFFADGGSSIDAAR